MNGKLYAFKVGTIPTVWALAGNGRVWIRSQTMAGQHQVDLTAVAVVGTDSPLLLLPVIGPQP